MFLETFMMSPDSQHSAPYQPTSYGGGVQPPCVWEPYRVLMHADMKNRQLVSAAETVRDVHIAAAPEGVCVPSASLATAQLFYEEIVSHKVGGTPPVGWNICAPAAWLQALGLLLRFIYKASLCP